MVDFIKVFSLFVVGLGAVKCKFEISKYQYRVFPKYLSVVQSYLILKKNKYTVSCVIKVGKPGIWWLK